MDNKILVIGATGAIGRNLVPALREKYGNENVIAGYNRRVPQGELAEGPIVQIDVTDKSMLRKIVDSHDVVSIYNLAALLSVAAEKNPELAERVNMGGLMNVLDIMTDDMTGFWASSIAVYGPGIPKRDVSEDVTFNPITVYGKGKVKGEIAIAESGKNMRVIRFPGLNGPGEPGPGTTEYAIEMIQAAAKGDHYIVPLRKDTKMPMMDMRDAVRAIMMLMSAEKVGKTYNISAFSFSPEQLAEVVREFNSDFEVDYQPDEMKQNIADSWPESLDDSRARKDWGWEPAYSLKEMVKNIYKEV